MSDLKDVAKRVAHHRPPVAIRRVERRLKARRSGGDRPLVRRSQRCEASLSETPLSDRPPENAVSAKSGSL